jgi:hypothetical protein
MAESNPHYEYDDEKYLELTEKAPSMPFHRVVSEGYKNGLTEDQIADVLRQVLEDYLDEELDGKIDIDKLLP